MYDIVSRDTAARAVRDLNRQVNDLLGLCQEVAGGVFFEEDSVTMRQMGNEIRERAYKLADAVKDRSQFFRRSRHFSGRPKFKAIRHVIDGPKENRPQRKTDSARCLQTETKTRFL